jgi:periplasmic copper chaperone A
LRLCFCPGAFPAINSPEAPDKKTRPPPPGTARMSRVPFLFAALFAVVLGLPAQAEDVTAGSLKISAPWARATPKGASIGGGYMKITNTGNAPDTLIGGSTDAATRFEIHEMSMDNGVMKMRALDKGLEIKPGQTVEFKPGGYHVMFVGLKSGLTQGQNVKATLEFAKAGKVDVEFTVQGIGAMTGGGGHDMPGMKQ